MKASSRQRAVSPATDKLNEAETHKPFKARRTSEAGGKVSASGDGDGGPTRRPAWFWGEFNAWWREELSRLGKRPRKTSVIQWFNSNAEMIWQEDTPTLMETVTHAKCLRSTEAVRDYFRKYRAQLSARKRLQEHHDSAGTGGDALYAGPGARAAIASTRGRPSHSRGHARHHHVEHDDEEEEEDALLYPADLVAAHNRRLASTTAQQMWAQTCWQLEFPGAVQQAPKAVDAGADSDVVMLPGQASGRHGRRNRSSSSGSRGSNGGYIVNSMLGSHSGARRPGTSLAGAQGAHSQQQLQSHRVIQTDTHMQPRSGQAPSGGTVRQGLKRRALEARNNVCDVSCSNQPVTMTATTAAAASGPGGRDSARPHRAALPVSAVRAPWPGLSPMLPQQQNASKSGATCIGQLPGFHIAPPLPPASLHPHAAVAAAAALGPPRSLLIPLSRDKGPAHLTAAVARHPSAVPAWDPLPPSAAFTDTATTDEDEDATLCGVDRFPGTQCFPFSVPEDDNLFRPRGGVERRFSTTDNRVEPGPAVFGSLGPVAAAAPPATDSINFQQRQFARTPGAYEDPCVSQSNSQVLAMVEGSQRAAQGGASSVEALYVERQRVQGLEGPRWVSQHSAQLPLLYPVRPGAVSAARMGRGVQPSPLTAAAAGSTGLCGRGPEKQEPQPCPLSQASQLQSQQQWQQQEPQPKAGLHQEPLCQSQPQSRPLSEPKPLQQDAQPPQPQSSLQAFVRVGRLTQQEGTVKAEAAPEVQLIPTPAMPMPPGMSRLALLSATVVGEGASNSSATDGRLAPAPQLPPWAQARFLWAHQSENESDDDDDSGVPEVFYD